MTRYAVDFLRPPPSSQLGWMLLAVGAMAVGAALWCSQRWTAEREQAELAEQRRFEAARVLQAARTPVPPPRDPRMEHAQAELNRPWMPALRAIEAATKDPVYLLSLTFERSSGLIKLDAEAPSFDHALAYTQMLEDGETLSSATLASHEQVNDAMSGRSVVRFSATARWSVR